MRPLVICAVLAVGVASAWGQDGAGVSWRDYTDARLCALEKATSLNAGAMEKRLDNLAKPNGFMPRGEYTAEHMKVVADINDLREFRARLEGKASQVSVMLTLAVAVIGIILSALGLWRKTGG
jgi:hypothetical protein